MNYSWKKIKSSLINKKNFFIKISFILIMLLEFLIPITIKLQNQQVNNINLIKNDQLQLFNSIEQVPLKNNYKRNEPTNNANSNLIKNLFDQKDFKQKFQIDEQTSKLVNLQDFTWLSNHKIINWIKNPENIQEDKLFIQEIIDLIPATLLYKYQSVKWFIGSQSNSFSHYTIIKILQILKTIQKNVIDDENFIKTWLNQDDDSKQNDDRIQMDWNIKERDVKLNEYISEFKKSLGDFYKVKKDTEEYEELSDYNKKLFNIKLKNSEVGYVDAKRIITLVKYICKIFYLTGYEYFKMFDLDNESFWKLWKYSFDQSANDKYIFRKIPLFSETNWYWNENTEKKYTFVELKELYKSKGIKIRDGITKEDFKKIPIFKLTFKYVGAYWPWETDEVSFNLKYNSEDGKSILNWNQNIEDGNLTVFKTEISEILSSSRVDFNIKDFFKKSDSKTFDLNTFKTEISQSKITITELFLTKINEGINEAIDEGINKATNWFISSIFKGVKNQLKPDLYITGEDFSKFNNFFEKYNPIFKKLNQNIAESNTNELNIETSIKEKLLNVKKLMFQCYETLETCDINGIFNSLNLKEFANTIANNNHWYLNFDEIKNINDLLNKNHSELMRYFKYINDSERSNNSEFKWNNLVQDTKLKIEPYVIGNYDKTNDTLLIRISDRKYPHKKYSLWIKPKNDYIKIISFKRNDWYSEIEPPIIEI